MILPFLLCIHLACLSFLSVAAAALPPLPAAAPPMPPPLLPAKRPADHHAHLLAPAKRHAMAAPGERHPMWGDFDVDEKKEEKEEEKKDGDPAPETMQSELTRYFAQNPPDAWSFPFSSFLCAISWFDFVRFLQGIT